MQPPFRSKQEVIIDAPLEAVWSFSMDLTKIPEFHPRVVTVDLLSGKTLREPLLTIVIIAAPPKVASTSLKQRQAGDGEQACRENCGQPRAA